MRKIFFLLFLAILLSYPVSANETPFSRAALDEQIIIIDPPAPLSVTIHVGETRQLTIPGAFIGTPITWSSNNTAIAAVSDSGLVTGISPGTAVITATAADAGMSVAYAVIVTNAPETGITINKPSTSVQVGGTDLLEVIFAPDVIWHFTWSSSNPAVATVIPQHPELGNIYGLVTGISPGTAAITATRVDGAGYATCEVTIIFAGTEVNDDNSGSGDSGGGGCNVGYGGISLLFAVLMSLVSFMVCRQRREH